MKFLSPYQFLVGTSLVVNYDRSLKLQQENLKCKQRVWVIEKEFSFISGKLYYCEVVHGIHQYFMLLRPKVTEFRKVLTESNVETQRESELLSSYELGCRCCCCLIYFE